MDCRRLTFVNLRQTDVRGSVIICRVLSNSPTQIRNTVNRINNTFRRNRKFWGLRNIDNFKKWHENEAVYFQMFYSAMTTNDLTISQQNPTWTEVHVSDRILGHLERHVSSDSFARFWCQWMCWIWTIWRHSVPQQRRPLDRGQTGFFAPILSQVNSKKISNNELIVSIGVFLKWVNGQGVSANSFICRSPHPIHLFQCLW